MIEHFGQTEASLMRLRGPIGIYIGSKTPAEIAVSGAVSRMLSRVASTTGPPARMKTNEGRKVKKVATHAPAIPDVNSASGPNTSFVQPPTKPTKATIMISGPGVVSILSGTTTFTAANTYTGVTTVGAGTLQVGNGGTRGTLGTGAVSNNSVLVFNVLGVSGFGDQQILTTPRIGVDYAGHWARRLLRFYLKGNPHVSRP